MYSRTFIGLDHFNVKGKMDVNSLLSHFLDNSQYYFDMRTSYSLFKKNAPQDILETLVNQVRNIGGQKKNDNLDKKDTWYVLLTIAFFKAAFYGLLHMVALVKYIKTERVVWKADKDNELMSETPFFLAEYLYPWVKYFRSEHTPPIKKDYIYALKTEHYKVLQNHKQLKKKLKNGELTEERLQLLLSKSEKFCEKGNKDDEMILLTNDLKKALIVIEEEKNEQQEKEDQSRRRQTI